VGATDAGAGIRGEVVIGPAPVGAADAVSEGERVPLLHVPTQAEMMDAATAARSAHVAGAFTWRAPDTSPSRPRSTTHIVVPSTVTLGEPRAATARAVPSRSSSAAMAISLGQLGTGAWAATPRKHITVTAHPNISGTIADFHGQGNPASGAAMSFAP
jgi:hypothetical protein